MGIEVLELCNFIIVRFESGAKGLMAAYVKRIDSVTSVKIDDVETTVADEAPPAKAPDSEKYRLVARRCEGVVPLVALWQ